MHWLQSLQPAATAPIEQRHFGSFTGISLLSLCGEKRPIAAKNYAELR
jgi:hypothetical protein